MRRPIRTFVVATVETRARQPCGGRMQVLKVLEGSTLPSGAAPNRLAAFADHALFV
jgi:hypothetical protein